MSDASGWVEPLGEEGQAEVEEIGASVRQRRRLDARFLREVVAEWRQHDRIPSVTAEVLHVSVSQLHRYLQKARDLGLADDYARRTREEN